jgi:periplasmic protein TonB
MKLKKRYWTAAFVFSLAVHAGAAAVLMREDDEEVQVAGGERFEIALLGNAFEDAVSAGSETATVEPLEAVPQAAEPVQPTIAEPVEQRATPEIVTPSPETAMEQPVTPDRTVPIAPSETAETPPQEAEETPAAEPVDPEAAAEVEAEETVAALVHVPVPTARPAKTVEEVKPTDRAQEPVEPVSEREKAVEPEKREPRKQERAERKERKAPPKRQQAGNGGNAQADARKGQADGAERGSQAAAGRTGNSREAGNAAVSNYPGKVVTKLRRALRYPARARRERLRGEVQVSFTVGGGGSVSDIRVVRSSGLPVLDQAALETVRRAAPFPPIPDDRPNWSFTVPLAFTR